MPSPTPWVIDRNGGLDERGFLSPVDGNQILQSLNTSWMTEGVLCLRRGSKSQSLTSSGFTGPLKWAGVHLTNAGVEELWGNATNAGTAALARRSAGTWSAVTYSDTVTVANLLYHHSATQNGKFFLAYDSDVNRLHVWDGTVLRRVGIIASAAPTVADTGAGAYAATLRFYKVAWRIKSGSDVIATSELSPAVSFTPSGGGTAARVTKPTTPDSATHWVVYGFTADTYSSYKELAEIAVGTTTYDDSTAPGSYAGTAPQTLGLNIPPPSAKFIVSDGLRLLMANAWESSGSAGQTAPKVNRVWFTRVLGASDTGDDESIPNTTTLKYWIDIGDAGPITGLLGPIYGEIYVFKARSVWKLVPTGDENAPYRRVELTDTCGALDQRAIVSITKTLMAFADETNVYQMGANSEPTPISESLAMSLSYSALTSTAWLAYDQWSKMLLVMSADASESGFWFDTVKLRWGTLAWNGQFNRAVTTNQDDGGKRLICVGDNGVADASLVVAFGHTLPADNSVEFTGTVRVRRVLAPGYRVNLGCPTVWYRAPDATGTLTLTMTFTREDGDTLSSGSVTLTPTSTAAAASGTRYAVGKHTIESLRMADATVADVTISLLQAGGGGLGASPPTIDLITIPYTVGEPLPE